MRRFGYNAFKLVAQSVNRTDLHDCTGSQRPLFSAGHFGSEVQGVGNCVGDECRWNTVDEILQRVGRHCFVHSLTADPASFFDESHDRPIFRHHDFAVLKAVFPLESRDEEEWFDIHCTWSTELPDAVWPEHDQLVKLLGLSIAASNRHISVSGC